MGRPQKTKLYYAWVNMRNRCYNSKTERYKNYGGRGIRVCDEWRSRFAPFKDWAESAGYTEGLQIDRIDNDGDYTPANCRWVTPLENARNKQNSRKLSTGESFAQAAARVGLAENTLYERMRAYGWTEEKALSQPLRKKRK